jgi:hypothetical protein
MNVNLTRISIHTKQESGPRERFFRALKHLPIAPASAQLAEMISAPLAVKALNLAGASAVNAQVPKNFSVATALHALDLPVRRAVKASGSSRRTASMALMPGEHGESLYPFLAFCLQLFG